MHHGDSASGGGSHSPAASLSASHANIILDLGAPPIAVVVSTTVQPSAIKSKTFRSVCGESMVMSLPWRGCRPLAYRSMLRLAFRYLRRHLGLENPCDASSHSGNIQKCSRSSSGDA